MQKYDSKIIRYNNYLKKKKRKRFNIYQEKSGFYKFAS